MRRTSTWIGLTAAGLLVAISAEPAAARVSLADLEVRLAALEARSQTVSYSLAAAAVSPPITLLPNVPIHVLGTQTVFGSWGIGSVSLLSRPGAGGFIEWVGLDSTAGAAITQGFSGVAGTKILFLDFDHCVQLEVAGVGGSNRVAVHNLCGAARSGDIRLFY